MAKTDLQRQSKTGPHLSKTLGAIVGGLTVVGFTVVHDLWISDIWFNLGPMLFAGALSGLAVVWSYNQAVSDHTSARWYLYNAANAGLLVGLGAVSFLVFEPRYTMAEAMVMDDALGELLPPAIPLMVTAILVGTVVVWATFGRKPRALASILVAQILLVFLIGHNLAILGLVETSGTLLRLFAEFIGLTVFLAGAYAVGVMAGSRFRRRSARSVPR